MALVKLAEYLEQKNLTQRDFARLSGVDEGMLSHYLNGQRRPGLRYALAIEKATDGAIPAEYWSDLKTKKRKQ